MSKSKLKLYLHNISTYPYTTLDSHNPYIGLLYKRRDWFSIIFDQKSPYEYQILISADGDDPCNINNDTLQVLGNIQLVDLACGPIKEISEYDKMDIDTGESIFSKDFDIVSSILNKGLSEYFNNSISLKDITIPNTYGLETMYKILQYIPSIIPGETTAENANEPFDYAAHGWIFVPLYILFRIYYVKFGGAQFFIEDKFIRDIYLTFVDMCPNAFSGHPLRKLPGEAEFITSNN